MKSKSTAFEALSIPKPLLLSIEKLGFETPTPIQAKAIPLALEGKDLIGSAQTGSGKTLAYMVPILARLIDDKKAMALVLVPTRELATQVLDVVRDLTRHTSEIKTAKIIGGASMQPQTRDLKRGARLIIATPGRMIDHLGRRTLRMDQLKFLVLDEADRMLDMGFAPQINEIVKSLPQQRQSFMFSATMPKNIQELASRLLRNPEKVSHGEVNSPVPQIKQIGKEVQQNHKSDQLLEEINARPGATIVFARTQSRADRVAKFLQSYDLPAGALHGGLTQGQRNRAMLAFRKGETRILVATDLAARGLDVSEVAHVINFDLPQVPEDYVHRIGRTGRAGREGEAISFVSREELGKWRAIVRLLAQTKGAAAPEWIGKTQMAPVKAPQMTSKPQSVSAPRRERSSHERSSAAPANPRRFESRGHKSEQRSSFRREEPRSRYEGDSPREKRTGSWGRDVAPKRKSNWEPRGAWARGDESKPREAHKGQTPKPVQAFNPEKKYWVQRTGDKPQRSGEKPAQKRPFHQRVPSSRSTFPKQR